MQIQELGVGRTQLRAPLSSQYSSTTIATRNRKLVKLTLKLRNWNRDWRRITWKENDEGGHGFTWIKILFAPQNNWTKKIFVWEDSGENIGRH